MGYTHYYTPKVPKIFYDDKWNKFLDETKEIIKEGGKLGIVIRDGIGKGKPYITDTVVSINGDGSKGEDHETLYIEKNNTNWAFCKTARKPYDTVVCAVLLSAKQNLGFELSSDGNEDEWQSGVDLYLNTVFGGTVEMGEIYEDESFLS
jgi:hypothetical protein